MGRLEQVRNRPLLIGLCLPLHIRCRAFRVSRVRCRSGIALFRAKPHKRMIFLVDGGRSALERRINGHSFMGLLTSAIDQ